jgi:hypothetical protein
MATLKKLLSSKRMHWHVLLMALLVNMQIASGQTKQKQTYVIPDDINAIFNNSCMSCHGVKGGIMPLAKLNFAKWEKYGAAKEAERASKICGMLTAGKMPPEKFRKSNPELIPTKEQIGLICKWAESLKTSEGKQ